MPNYRRARAGRTYFFTVVTYNRQPFLCSEENRTIFRQVIKEIRLLKPFEIDAWVLLPDHLHCIWTLPEGDADYSKRWGLIKARFTKKVGWALPAIQSPSRLKHREGFVWQRRFWEHQIRDEKDFEAHCNYIHYNPVKHKYASAPKDWAYSTFHKFVKQGTYSVDWGSSSKVALPDDISGE
ncbi:MAG: transposase [Deltaproteobacteria bacterium RBG_16_42_7]|nr:MAG: transposase [Deltaproteobacteria bacterium RBG_16_42_7]